MTLVLEYVIAKVMTLAYDNRIDKKEKLFIHKITVHNLPLFCRQTLEHNIKCNYGFHFRRLCDT